MYQPLSTAINTSNIGLQSVNYSNSSGYANSAGSAVDQTARDTANSKVKCSYVQWGSSLSFSYTVSSFIIISSKTMYSCWSSASTNLGIINTSTNKIVDSSNGSVSIDNLTLTRSGNNITINSSSQSTLLVIYF